MPFTDRVPGRPGTPDVAQRPSDGRGAGARNRSRCFYRAWSARLVERSADFKEAHIVPIASARSAIAATLGLAQPLLLADDGERGTELFVDSLSTNCRHISRPVASPTNTSKVHRGPRTSNDPCSLPSTRSNSPTHSRVSARRGRRVYGRSAEIGRLPVPRQQFGDLPDRVIGNAGEFSNEPFVRGVVAMARTSDPNSADSQFFIMFAPAPSLDGKYTIWGEVTSGMDYVDQIKRATLPSTAPSRTRTRSSACRSPPRRSRRRPRTSAESDQSEPSFPRKREPGADDRRRAPVHDRGRLWTPACAGATIENRSGGTEADTRSHTTSGLPAAADPLRCVSARV
jgi:cyclophilin family peptidyl-prolyl cis-trans isomerase